MGSIRNLLVHTGYTHEFWIGRHALHKRTDVTDRGSIPDALAAGTLFRTGDILMEEFFPVYSRNQLEDLKLSINGGKSLQAR
ncbi:hypothetical protein [Sabulibacter ruber]|uniref:hypothetical protein n=1 Tax=Sabulibacter ruber TaxID=2811901 RepID=UPI001A97D113|nr:hypothetical protein [Sabulibacter ruber]